MKKIIIINVAYLLIVSAVVYVFCSRFLQAANDVVRERACIAWVDGVYSAVLSMEVMADAKMSDDDKLAILRGAVQCQEFDFTGEEIVDAYNKLYEIYREKEMM